MASRLLTTLGQALFFVQATAHRVLAIATAEDSAGFATWPTITAGSAAPTEAQPNGSIYLRTNGLLYTRTGAAWVNEDAAGAAAAAAAAQADATQGIADAAAAQATGDAAQIDATQALVNAAAVLAELRVAEARPTLTPAAEAANAIAIAIQIEDATHAPSAGVQRCKCTVYDADMVPALAAAFTATETGTGSIVSTPNRPAILIATDASGVAELTVTDVSGVFVGSVFVEVAPESGGVPTIVEIAFA